jgi:hypothetical protein
MAADRYQKVYVKLWLSESFRALSDAGRLLFLYLLTCPSTTMLTGLVAISVGTIADHLGLAPDTVRGALAELDAEGMAAFDPAGVVWLPNALAHNPPANPSVVKGWRRHWSEVPNCPLKVAAYQALRLWCERKGLDWLGAFDTACARPVLSAGRGSGPQKPAARHGVAHGVPHRVGDGVAHGVGDRPPHGVAHQYQEQEQYQEQKRESAAASARASARPRAYACESAPATSPSARVLAEVVSTEPPPSRTPPLPVQVETAAPSHATGPLASPDAGPESQPPPAVRAPSVPRPEPVAAPAAPVAPLAPPSPPLARTTPAQLPLDDADPADAPAAVALPRVSDLDERTPANRVLRAWGARCYAAAHQPLATEARRRVVRDRLRVFPEADLVRAIDAAMRDPYVNGQSDRAPSGGQRDIAWLFAKVERVERFLAAPAPPPPPAPLPTRLPPARTPPPLPPGAPVLTREEFDAGALQALPPPRRYTVAELEAAAHGATHAR